MTDPLSLSEDEAKAEALRVLGNGRNVVYNASGRAVITTNRSYGERGIYIVLKPPVPRSFASIIPGGPGPYEVRYRKVWLEDRVIALGRSWLFVYAKNDDAFGEVLQLLEVANFIAALPQGASKR